MSDDAELLRLYLSGQDPAFAELVRRHVDLVYSVALRQMEGDVHRASDVSQVVFAALARKARALSEHPVLGGWLYRTTLYAAADARRAEARRRDRERKLAVMQEAPEPPPAPNADSPVDWARIRPVLDHAISDLPQNDRDAVVLRFFEGRSFAEMGRRLHVTEDAARKRVGCALDRMRKALGRRGVKSTDAALAAVLLEQVATAAPSGLAASLAIPAGGAASLAPTAFTLMKTSSAWKIGLGLTVLVAGTTTIALQQHALSRLQAQNDTLAKAQADAGRLRSENGRLRGTIAAQAAQLRAAGRSGGRTHGGVLDAAAVATTMNKPEMQRLMALQSRIGLDTRYAPLFKKLHLSTDKLDQLKQLMVSRQMVQTDVFASAAQQGLDPMQDSRELAGLARDGQQKVDEEIQSLLGDADYASFQGYQQTLPQRTVVDQLQQTLSYTNDPLTDAQAEQLVQLLAQNPAPAPSAGASNPRVVVATGSIGGGSNGQPPLLAAFGAPPITDSAVAAASSVLSPAQVSALQGLQQQQQALSTALQSVRTSSGQIAVPNFVYHAGGG